METQQTTCHEVETKALTMPEKAKSIQILDNNSFERAGEFLTNLKKVRKEINTTFDPIIKKQFEAHKEAISQKKKVEKPIIEAENIIKDGMALYAREFEKARQEKEEELRIAAKKRAEDRQIADAAEAESNGNHEEAEKILNEKPNVTPVVFQMDKPKVNGVSTRKTWKFKITDPNKIPDEYKTIDEKKIGAVIRALKDKSNIPGVEVFCEEQVVAKAV